MGPENFSDRLMFTPGGGPHTDSGEPDRQPAPTPPAQPASGAFKRMVDWEENLHEKLPKGTVIKAMDEHVAYMLPADEDGNVQVVRGVYDPDQGHTLDIQVLEEQNCPQAEAEEVFNAQWRQAVDARNARVTQERKREELKRKRREAAKAKMKKKDG